MADIRPILSTKFWISCWLSCLQGITPWSHKSWKQKDRLIKRGFCKPFVGNLITILGSSIGSFDKERTDRRWLDREIHIGVDLREWVRRCGTTRQYISGSAGRNQQVKEQDLWQFQSQSYTACITSFLFDQAKSVVWFCHGRCLFAFRIGFFI